MKRSGTAAFLLILVSACTIATPADATPPGPSATPSAAAGGDAVSSARMEDLDFLIKELPTRHPNAFATRSREAFMADADALRARLADLDDAQFMIELSRLIASLGDGHTSLAKPMGRYPAQVAFFADGPRVIVLPKSHATALGGKLVAIGDQPIDEVMRLLATVEACETETTSRALARNFIVAPEVLHGLGLAAPRSALFVIESDEGTRQGLSMDALPKEATMEWATLPPGGDMVRMRNPRLGALLLPIDDGKSLYLAYRRCTVDPQAPIADAMKSLLERIDREAPRRVVIDLRGNGGGNSALLSAWLPELAKRSASRERGWLAVLIDRHTFSSAMMNAWQLQRDCNAVLYGEPTGGAKNHFGEVRTFKLPRSGWTVQHSTKFFKLDESGRGPVNPDVRTNETFADYQAGRDATLEAALAGTASDSSKHLAPPSPGR